MNKMNWKPRRCASGSPLCPTRGRDRRRDRLDQRPTCSRASAAAAARAGHDVRTLPARRRTPARRPRPPGAAPGTRRPTPRSRSRSPGPAASDCSGLSLAVGVRARRRARHPGAALADRPEVAERPLARRRRSGGGDARPRSAGPEAASSPACSSRRAARPRPRRRHRRRHQHPRQDVAGRTACAASPASTSSTGRGDAATTLARVAPPLVRGAARVRPRRLRRVRRPLRDARPAARRAPVARRSASPRASPTASPRTAACGSTRPTAASDRGHERRGQRRLTADETAATPGRDAEGARLALLVSPTWSSSR